MEISFQTESLLMTFLVLFTLTILPVKIAATVFGATYNGLNRCVISVFLGTVLVILCTTVIGGFMGLVAMYIAVSFVYSKMLGLSLSWSFLFTFGVFFIQVGIIQAATKLGIFT